MKANSLFRSIFADVTNVLIVADNGVQLYTPNPNRLGVVHT
jgi:hypothetical protein